MLVPDNIRARANGGLANLRVELTIPCVLATFAEFPPCAAHKARKTSECQGWRLEGSRFGSRSRDLAPFFSARVWPQTVLNRRLPQMAQRVVCLLGVREIDCSNRPLD
jgi:hypothetical protein